MNFAFTRAGLSPRERALERFFEILPGAVSWSLLAGMTLLSFRRPLLAAVFIILFDLYWLLRLFYVTIFLVLSYLELERRKDTDWLGKIRGMGAVSPEFSELVHLVILPIASESRAVLEPSIRSFASGRLPAKQILVVLAVEGRAAEAIRCDAQALAREYAGRFLEIFVAVHPDGLPGEARVKGANATFAAKEAARYLERRKVPFENVVVSCFDSDTVAGPEYFACLSYHFLACPDRLRASFQPIPVYHNNVWQAPGYARVLEMGSSFFQLTEATYPEKLVTFSSHSMSFQALVDVGYWPVDIVSDDSAIYWKAFIHYDGDYRVVPLYTTLSMDIVHTGSWRGDLLAVYKQKRRWAWGVENFPIVMRAFLANGRIPFVRKCAYGSKLFEGHIAWATWPLLLAVIGWLPALLAAREFSSSVMYYSAPRITAIIFNIASLSLVTTIVLSLRLLPARKVRNPLWKRFGHVLEWLCIPVTAVLFSALPALDSQTRLMLGRYMEFQATEHRPRKRIS